MHLGGLGLEGLILALQVCIFFPLGALLGGLLLRSFLGGLGVGLIFAVHSGPFWALLLGGGLLKGESEVAAMAYLASPGSALAALLGGVLLLLGEARRRRK